MTRKTTRPRREEAVRNPLLLPLAGRPGTVAVLTTPDALDGASALNPDDRYPDWRQEVAARSLLRAGGPGGQGGPHGELV